MVWNMRLRVLRLIEPLQIVIGRANKSLGCRDDRRAGRVSQRFQRYAISTLFGKLGVGLNLWHVNVGLILKSITDVNVGKLLPDADSYISLLHTGAVLLVSHDQRLLHLVAKELWVADGGRIERFDGDFYAYKSMIAARLKWTCTACFNKDWNESGCMRMVVGSLTRH